MWLNNFKNYLHSSIGILSIKESNIMSTVLLYYRNTFLLFLLRASYSLSILSWNWPLFAWFLTEDATEPPLSNEFKTYLWFPPSKIFYALFVCLIVDNSFMWWISSKRNQARPFTRIWAIANLSLYLQVLCNSKFLINGTYFSYLPNYHLSSGRTIVLCPNIISFLI